ncbi:hypothetical protein RRG08_021869 [Elysia crispata]|uniref:Uncharacterized protein n=1 Tax=Elysia crispata TaxID=231223 RepID=A0AAE0XEQ0_9GAST|nr:hypothetical protein RRG08_021869 [Elysia crispata]
MFVLNPEILIMQEAENEPLPSHTYSDLSRAHPLQEAHAKCYLAGNARFSTYGHLPLESHMEFIDNSQVEFSQVEPSVGEPLEPCWEKSVGRSKHNYELCP